MIGLALLLVPLPLVAQAPDVDPDRLRLDTLLHTEIRDDRVTLTHTLNMASAGEGWVLAPALTYPHVAVLSADGRVTAVLTRTGDGPGELDPQGQIFVAAPDPDRILIFQGIRLQEFDRSLRPLATWMLPSTGFTFAAPSSGRVVLNQPTQRAHASHVVRTFRRDRGRWTEAGSSVEPVPGLGPGWSVLRLLEPAPVGGFMSGHPGRSTVLVHDPDGGVRRRITPVRSWFDEWTRGPELGFAPLHLTAFKLLSDRHLVLVTVIHHDPAEATAAFLDPWSDPGTGRETIVEVVRTDTGDVAARRRLTGHWRSVAGPEAQFYALAPLADGTFRLTVARAVFDAGGWSGAGTRLTPPGGSPAPAPAAPG